MPTPARNIPKRNIPGTAPKPPSEVRPVEIKPVAATQQPIPPAPKPVVVPAAPKQSKPESKPESKPKQVTKPSVSTVPEEKTQKRASRKPQEPPKPAGGTSTPRKYLTKLPPISSAEEARILDGVVSDAKDYKPPVSKKTKYFDSTVQCGSCGVCGKPVYYRNPLYKYRNEIFCTEKKCYDKLMKRVRSDAESAREAKRQQVLAARG